MATIPTTSIPRPDLGFTFEEYTATMAQMGLVAPIACPPLPVEDAAGDFPKIRVESYLTDDRSLLRAEGSSYESTSGSFEIDRFATLEYGLKHAVDDRMANRLSYMFSQEQLGRDIILTKLMIAAEKRVADLLTGSDIATTGVSNGAWSASSATPITDLISAIEAVRLASGVLPNAVFIPFTVAAAIAKSGVTQLFNRVADSTDKTPRTVMRVLRESLDMEGFTQVALYTAGAVKGNQKKGQAFSGVDVWDKTQVVVCTVQNGTTAMPQTARTFAYTGDGAGYEPVFDMYREENSRGYFIRGRHDVQEKLIMPATARRITGVLAS